MIINLDKSHNLQFIVDEDNLHIIDGSLHASWSFGFEGILEFASFLDFLVEENNYLDFDSKLNDNISFWAEAVDEGFRNIGIDYYHNRVMFNLYYEDIKNLSVSLKGLKQYN